MSYDQNRISVFWSVVCLPSCKKIGAKVAARKVFPTASSIRKERVLERESLEQIAFRNCTACKQKFIFNIKVEQPEQNGCKRLTYNYKYMILTLVLV